MSHLVVSRREKERVVVTVPPSSTETVVVVELNQVRGSAARFGFHAPRDVRVVREELLERRSA